jgi:DNA polymerase-3 subunit beta
MTTNVRPILLAKSPMKTTPAAWISAPRKALVDALAITDAVEDAYFWASFDAQGDEVTMTVYIDQRLQGKMTSRIAGAIGQGDMLVDALELAKLLDDLVDGASAREGDTSTATLTAGAGEAWLEIGGSTVPLRALPPESWQALPAPPEQVCVDGTVLATEAARVLRAVNPRDTAWVLTYVQLTVEVDQVILVGTDRYRLAVGCVPVLNGDWAVTRQPSLIPCRALTAITRAAKGHRVRIGVAANADGSWISFSWADTNVTLRLEPGKFPDHAKLLPTTAVGRITVDREQLLGQTRQAGKILKTKNEPGGFVKMLIGDDSVAVVPWLTDYDAPGYHSDVIAPGIPSDIAGIGAGSTRLFNPRYLAEALASFHGRDVTLHLAEMDNEQPLVLLTSRPDQLADPTAFRHLLMCARPNLQKTVTRTQA